MSNWTNEGRNFMERSAETAQLRADLAAARADRDDFMRSLEMTSKVAGQERQRAEQMEQERDAARAEAARLREAVEAGFVEGWRLATGNSEAAAHGVMKAAWLASEARKGLEGER